MGSVLLLTSSFLTGACLALSWPSSLDVSRLSAIFKMVGHELYLFTQTGANIDNGAKDSPSGSIALLYWYKLDLATSSNYIERSFPRIYNALTYHPFPQPHVTMREIQGS